MTPELWILVAAASRGLVHMTAASLASKAESRQSVPLPAQDRTSKPRPAGRILFLPLYAIGALSLRTLSWNLATSGLVLIGTQSSLPALELLVTR